MHDIIVIGGGPGGSTSAALLAQKGHSVLLLERDRFPRFQIGESLLPYNNDLFEKLGILNEIPSDCSFPKYGAEFVTGNGEVSMTFRFANNLPERYSRSLQVKRAEFDHLLLRKAAEKGADVREGMTVRDVDLSDPAKVVVRAVDREGREFVHEARFVVDASGHGAVVGTRKSARKEEPALRKIALFAHYRNVLPGGDGRDRGNTVISILKNAWFWLIPITEDVTSVGLVIDRDAFLASGLTPETFLDQTIQSTPYVAQRLSAAERVSQIYARKDFSYRMETLAGPNYVLVGDAAGFFDPIFSTGVFMAMKTAEVASEAVDAQLRHGSKRPLRQYERMLRKAFDYYFHFIQNFYRREFLEVFLRPQPKFGLLPVVVGVLAGDVFEKKRNRWRLKIFFLLTMLQKRTGVIAPPIDWDTLPAAAAAAQPSVS